MFPALTNAGAAPSRRPSSAVPLILLVAALPLLPGCKSMPEVAMPDVSMPKMFAAKEKPAPAGRPAWIDNPGDGASASAGVHVMGRHAQEELAISRAREELAKRLGVMIGSEHEVVQVADNDRMSTVSSKTIREQVKDREVKAVLKSKWLDPANGTLWVWLVPEN